VKILMVTSSYPKFPGDVTSPFIESIARSLAARGHAIDVVLPHHPDLRLGGAGGTGEPLRFFPYRYAPRPEWSRWGYAQSLRADVKIRKSAWLLAPLAALAVRSEVARRLRETRYDAVHAHWLVPNAAFVAGVARAHRAPFVVSLHGSDVFLAERLAPARALGRRALAAAGAITACSDDLHRRAWALGARRDRIRTVPYGVDVDRFAPARADRTLRARWDVPPGATLVVAVGRLVEKKGFAHLVDAARCVEDVHVVVAGDGDLRPALEQRARGVGDRVRFVGALDRDTVARAVAAADVVAVPSVVDAAGNVDGLPNTVLEALASGRALVASRVAGIPEVVEDDVNGLLVPAGDVAALAAALARLARDPAARERLGREARARAVARLGWDAVARSFEECYAQAAALDAG
jgi:glycosyltransferase involved in cell wall biosynthesis